MRLEIVVFQHITENPHTLILRQTDTFCEVLTLAPKWKFWRRPQLFQFHVKSDGTILKSWSVW